MNERALQNQNSPGEKHYENEAFISYKRDNSDVATWLRKRLSWYRFPAKLVAREYYPPHPKYIRPIILDKTSLEVDPGPFWEKIKEKIDNSRFLIVLCSPQAARPDQHGRHWVEDEVRHFLANPSRNNPIDHVIPVIMAGKPGTGGADECLPPALRDPRLLNRTLPRMVPDRGETEKECRENALIQIISYLLRVERNRIFDEFQREKRRKNQRLLAVVSLLLVVFAGLAGFAFYARYNALQTLAQADFQEASRLLDKGDTGLALAYLAASQEKIAYRPALERLHGLLLQRSWLIGRNSMALRGDGTGPRVISPGLDRRIQFRIDPATKKSTIKIDSVFKEKDRQGIEIPIDDRSTVFFSSDGSAIILLKDDDRRQNLKIHRVADGSPLGGCDIPVTARLAGMSPNGKVMLVVLPDNSLRLVAATTGQQLLELDNEEGRRWKRYLPDEFYALDETTGDEIIPETAGMADPVLESFGTSSRLIVLDQQMVNLPGYPGLSLPQYSFNEDGTIFVVADESASRAEDHAHFSYSQSLLSETGPSFRLRAFRVADGRELLNVTGQGALGHFACSPAGIHVAYTTSRDTVYDWQLVVASLNDQPEDDRRYPLPRHPQKLLFSPDGRYIVTERYRDSGSDSGSMVSIHDIFLGNKKKITLPLEKTMKAWAFSHDARRMAILTNTPELRVINLKSGNEVVERRRLDGIVSSVAFSRSDCALLLSTPDEIRSYDLRISPVAPRKITPKLSSMPLADVAPTPDGKHMALLLTDTEKTGAVELVSTQGRRTGSLLPLDRAPNCAVFSPHGNILAVGTGSPDLKEGEGGVLLFHISPEDTGTPQKWRQLSFLKLPSAVTRLEFSQGEEHNLLLLVGEEDSKGSGGVHLYDVDAQKMLPPFIEHDGSIDVAHFSPDGRLVATAGTDERIRLWDIDKRTLSAETKSSSFPDTLVFGPKGSIAYTARLLNSRGEVMVLTPKGEPAWPGPRKFLHAVSHVAFDAGEEMIAVGSRGKEVYILDAETGRPRTAPISLQYPISALRFVSTGSENVLCVACGHDNAGYVAFFSPESGRLIADLISHPDRIRGMESTAGGHLLSWTLGSVLISACPGPVGSKTDRQTRKHLAEITGELGGLVLNTWRAPEPYRPDEAGVTPLSGPWARTWSWLQEPLETRAIEPGSPVRLSERLQRLCREGYLEEYEAALNVKPDYRPALAEYWFPAAREIIEDEFMRAAQGKSRLEYLQRELAWAALSQSPAELVTRLQNNPYALRIADFNTREACKKLPDDGRIWRERATFLRLSAKTEAALQAIEQAVALNPSDIDSQIQLARVRLEERQSDTALDGLNQACDKVSRDGTGALDTVVSLGLLRMEVAMIKTGFAAMPDSVSWLLAEIEKRMKGEVPRDAPQQLLYYAEKVIGPLLRFSSGPEIAKDFNLRLAELLQEKRISSQDESIIVSFLSYAAYCALLADDIPGAMHYSKRALALASDNITPPGLFVYGHALCASGKIDEALRVYREAITFNPMFSGIIVRNLYDDFLFLERKGVSLKGIEPLKKELAAQLAGEFEKGFTVTAVMPGSQAEDAGILVGDRIIRYNNEPIVEIRSFTWDRQAEEHAKTDERRPLLVMRGDKQLQFQVQPGLLGVGLIRSAGD